MVVLGCEKEFVNQVLEPPEATREFNSGSWLVHCTREEAVNRLRALPHGAFLVRQKDNAQLPYVLSVVWVHAFLLFVVLNFYHLVFETVNVLSFILVYLVHVQPFLFCSDDLVDNKNRWWNKINNHELWANWQIRVIVQLHVCVWSWVVLHVVCWILAGMLYLPKHSYITKVVENVNNSPRGCCVLVA